MAKKTKTASGAVAEPKEELAKEASPESTNPGTPKKRGRGRPKGSAKKTVVKKTGKRGRPKGSKNRPKSLVKIGKRPRGRPPGSGKKARVLGAGNLRAIITEIVRKEVHSALLEAFKGL